MKDDGSTKPMPFNKALQAFTPFIGVWKTIGTHGMIPNTILHGSATFSWHESGAFILIRSAIEEAVGIPNGLAIIGSDDVHGAYVMIYYDERGVSRHYEVTIQNNELKWSRESSDLSQRYTLTLSDDMQTIVSKGEISKDGSAWEQDLDLTYSRV